MATVYEAYQRMIALWYAACEVEDIDPAQRQAVFSDANPFKAEYEEAVRLWLNLKKG